MKHFQCRKRGKLDSVCDLNCKMSDGDLNTCGSCLSCIFTTKLTESTQWLLRAGDASKRTFLSGLLVRCRSIQVLGNIQNVLQVTCGKDFTYTRSKKPSLPEDVVTCSSDRALDTKLLGMDMIDTWEWFGCSHDWIKSRYLLSVLSLCDTELLRMLRNLANVLLVREKRAFSQFNASEDTEDEASSSPESTLSFHSQDHPHLGLLMQASSVFEPVDLCSDTDKDMNKAWSQRCTSEISRSNQPHDPSGLESFVLGGLFKNRGECEDTETDSANSEDPALLVGPGSSASMTGVSRYTDFIRCLPVHLAKRILGLLDKCSLRCCRNVSLHWRYLAEETMADIHARRLLQNQVMMMQSNSNNRVSDVYANILEVLVAVRDDQEGDTLSDVPKDKPFEAAYANVKTRKVPMEERNVYCGVYNVMVLLEKEDPYRVVNYSGGQLVAVGSKDRMVRLLHVQSKREATPAIKGHVGSIRALLLCEDRDMVISASFDLSIRCWSLRTKACLMLLRGHTGTINCLDLHGDRLVSGAKDCKVKVWNLQTGRCLEDLRFKHPSPVQCVKIDASLVYSSCDKGLLKIWDIDTASLLRAIDGHQSSVKCLCFDQWHLLSGDSDGQVMAWSTNWGVKECLITFNHPKEVRCVTLLYLRVITGCVDGRIRIFSLLTGDCLKVIKAEGKQSPVMDMHCHDNNILINTTSSVQLYQFAKVRWDYTVSAEGGKRGVVTAQAGSITEKSLFPLRTFPYAFVRAERMAQVGSSNRKIYDRNSNKQHESVGLSHHARSLSAPSMHRAQVSQQQSMRPATWSELLSYRRSKAYIDLQPEFISKPPSAIHPGRPVSRFSLDSQSETSRTPHSMAHTPRSTTQTPISTIQTPRSTIQTPRSTIQTPRSTTQTPRSNIQTPRSTTHTPRSTIQTPRSTTQTSRSTTQTPRSTIQTPRSTIQTPRSTIQTPRSTIQTPRSTIQTPRSTIQTPRSTTRTSQSTTTTSVREFPETTKMLVTCSEKAVCERMKKRGSHHPLTTQHTLLRVSSIQQAQCTDRASTNTELNARLRDAWGTPPLQDPPPAPLLRPLHPERRSSPALKQSSQTQEPPPHQQVFYGPTKAYVPTLTRALEHNTKHTQDSRDVPSTAPVDTSLPCPEASDGFRGHHTLSESHRRPHTAGGGAQVEVWKVGTVTTGAEEEEEPRLPESVLLRLADKHPGRRVKFEMPKRSPVPEVNLMDPFRERGGFRLLTDTQVKEYVRAQRQSVQSSQHQSSKKEHQGL